MGLLRTLSRAIALAALACSTALAQADDAPRQADMQMSGASRQQLIDSLAREVEQRYVFPQAAKEVAAALRRQQARGEFNSITSAQQLSEVLSQAMQTAGRDRHLRVMYSAAASAERKAETEPAAEEIARRLAMHQSNNFGVEKIERLPFNIGYLDLTRFSPAKDAAATLGAAMTVLAHSDALIIDLRNNGGGDATTSTMLASYLLDKRTHLGDFRYREGGRVEQRWSWDVVPGTRYGGKRAVYILTSSFTFSAAEDLAYALQNLQRATVVGERTGGGANAGDQVRLMPHFAAFIPRSRMVSPITGTNWEGVGVGPDINLCAQQALNAAQAAILQKWADAEVDPSRRSALQKRIAELAGEALDGSKCESS